MRKHANKLGRLSYSHKEDTAHTIHKEHKKAVKLYEKTLTDTKKQHWRDWLEKADDPDIWTVHRLISAPATDRGKSRIPALKVRTGEMDIVALSNKDKSIALANNFFPAKPHQENNQVKHKYPRQCDTPRKITKVQVEKQLKKLKPYKAPGPDGIPNIVLTKCANLLTNSLTQIYNAMLELNLQYKPWKHFNTIVLRKPGKPRYDTPKTFRPIVLLNTMWKVMTAIVTDHLSFLAEKHQLLPPHHFGRRPGHTTTVTGLG
jgi:hypothetical protein